MTRHVFHSDYHDCYEYHGNTAVERIRKQRGTTVKRDWIFFDSVEDAQEFFIDACEGVRGYYVH